MDDTPRDIVDRIKALTAADRCDQCGAQAYVESFHQHGRLLWCMSHYRVHTDRLAAAGIRVVVHHSEYQALAH